MAGSSGIWRPRQRAASTNRADLAKRAGMRLPTLVITAAILATALACCTLGAGGDEGLSVDVGMVATPHAGAPIETDLGYLVTLDRGFVAIASVEIHACDEAHASRSLARDLVEVLGSPLRVRAAHAHSTSSPTLLGVPGVLPLAPERDVVADLGELLPPPAKYCSTSVKLGPADDDAVMLPDSGDMVGLTLLVEGSWVAPAGGEAQSFRWASTATPGARRDTPFELAEDGPRSVREDIGVDVARIFDGIDLASVDPALGADRVAARIAEDLRVDIR
jgi:hypothetical protein